MNQEENTNYRTHFLSIFDWTDFTLELDAQEAVEAPFVGVDEIFALYCFEIGNITSVKVQRRLLDDKPAYSQSFLAPLNLRDGFLVEPALLEKYSIITKLILSKYGSPIFAQRKPNGKVCLLVDLRKLIKLIAVNYNKNNHLVSILTDAAQYMARKNLFC